MKSLRSMTLWGTLLGLGVFAGLRPADAWDRPISALSFGSDLGDRDDDGDNLDFAHFGTGDSVAFDLMLVNVATEAVRPAVYFYDKEGHPIAAESVVMMTNDMEVWADGSVRSRMRMEPLAEFSLSTHGQGDLVTGSVKVVSDGPIGGVLRFDLPGVGVAGVGASQPLQDALFPARRQAGGINTAAAIHNLTEEALVVSCQLLRAGAVLEEVEIPLNANGQQAQFIDEMFTLTDTSDFLGSVRCAAPDRFTGVAVEMDAGNRIFTTLPVVPLDRTEDDGKEATLDFAHFANGSGTRSELVLVNAATTAVRPTLYFFDKEGHPIAAESVVDITGDLEVREAGTLTVRTEIDPLGELTISTHGRGNLVTGSVTVVADGPIGGVLRFDLAGVGVAGVGASQPLQDALFPARRQAGGINTAAAIHNLTEEAMVVSCQLLKAGAVLEEVEIPLNANGQEAQFIDEMFTLTDTSDFLGSVRCTAPGRFTGVALEMDAGNRIFTTLPVVAQGYRSVTDATLSGSDSRYRVLTYYGQDTEIDLSSYLDEGVTGGTFTPEVVRCHASRLLRPGPCRERQAALDLKHFGPHPRGQLGDRDVVYRDRDRHRRCFSRPELLPAYRFCCDPASLGARRLDCGVRRRTGNKGPR